MMEGKVVLITGAARGMGRVTALTLARMGAEKVLLVDWQGEEGTRLRDRINREAGRPVADFLYCDLSSQQQLRELAEQVRQRSARLDVLINNAGITDPVLRHSVDGLEMHLATNHLAAFLLTGLLLDLLLASSPARIICVSSDAHKAGDGLDFNDINNEQLWRGKRVSNMAAFTAYHRSKLSNVLFVQALAQRLEGTGVVVNALSPGYFVNTSIYRNMRGVFKLGCWLVFGVGTLLRLNTPEKGARSHIYLASSPAMGGVSGQYFEHCRPKAVSKQAADREVQNRLWQVSEQLTAFQYPVLAGGGDE